MSKMQGGDRGDDTPDVAANCEEGANNLTQLFPKKQDPERPVTFVLPVTFDRQELREILNLYGRKVAEGEWRDYAIDFSPDKAVFAVYRRTSEVPLCRIEKDPRLARRQGAFCVVMSNGLVLRRGHDLKRVLGVLEKKTRLVAW